MRAAIPVATCALLCGCIIPHREPEVGPAGLTVMPTAMAVTLTVTMRDGALPPKLRAGRERILEAVERELAREVSRSGTFWLTNSNPDANLVVELMGLEERRSEGYVTDGFGVTSRVRARAVIRLVSVAGRVLEEDAVSGECAEVGPMYDHSTFECPARALLENARPLLSKATRDFTARRAGARHHPRLEEAPPVRDPRVELEDGPS